MRDTRLLQVLENARDSERLLTELMDDGIRDAHDLITVARAQKFAAALTAAMRSIYEPEVVR